MKPNVVPLRFESSSVLCQWHVYIINKQNTIIFKIHQLLHNICSYNLKCLPTFLSGADIKLRMLLNKSRKTDVLSIDIRVKREVRHWNDLTQTASSLTNRNYMSRKLLRLTNNKTVCNIAIFNFLIFIFITTELVCIKLFQFKWRFFYLKAIGYKILVFFLVSLLYFL